VERVFEQLSIGDIYGLWAASTECGDDGVALVYDPDKREFVITDDYYFAEAAGCLILAEKERLDLVDWLVEYVEDLSSDEITDWFESELDYQPSDFEPDDDFARWMHENICNSLTFNDCGQRAVQMYLDANEDEIQAEYERILAVMDQEVVNQ
jgi:hypothetical protein